MSQIIKWHRFPKEIPPAADRYLVTIKTYEGSLQLTVLRYVSLAGMPALRYFEAARVIAWAEVEPYTGEKA